MPARLPCMLFMVMPKNILNSPICFVNSHWIAFFYIFQGSCSRSRRQEWHEQNHHHLAAEKTPTKAKKDEDQKRNQQFTMMLDKIGVGNSVFQNSTIRFFDSRLVL